MIQPSLVIISHWDMDHFIGCVYASDDVFKVKWIATTLPEATAKDFSINAFRLATFLKATHKLMLVDKTTFVPLCEAAILPRKTGKAFSSKYITGRRSKFFWPAMFPITACGGLCLTLRSCVFCMFPIIARR